MSAVQQIAISLQRTWEGLKVTVKLHPRIEEFFRTRGEEQTSDVSLSGRYWRNKDKLAVYNLPPELAGAQSIARPDMYSMYRLDRPGDRLVMQGQDAINLSFLRLVGAGGEDGVSFVIPGVYPEETLTTLNRGFEQAAESFFRSFVKSVKLTSIISTIEREGGSGNFQEVRQSD